jgi:hypothetical protein
MRAEHVAENESLFRSVNESLVVDRTAVDPETGRHALLCECWNTDCVERVWLARAEYEAARTDSAQFVVVPGHVDPTVEEVVVSTDRYAVVRKRGEAAEVAAELDTRT